MAKIVLDPVTNGATLSTLNANFDKIEAEFQNRVAYRDNVSLETNTIKNDMDHDGNDIFNVNTIEIQDLVVQGVNVPGSDLASIPELRQDVDTLQSEMVAINTEVDILTNTVNVNAAVEDQHNKASLRTSGAPINPISEIGDRAGKFLAFDPAGQPVSSFGTGADIGLRSDLAANNGAGLVGWDGGQVSDLRVAGDTTGAELVPFLPSDISVAFQSSQQKMREGITLADFGAFGDGNLYTVASWIIPGVKGKYINLAAVQIDYPFVTSTTNDANWAALMKAEAYAVSSGYGRINLGHGDFAYASTWVMGSRGITVAGIEGSQSLGSSSVPSMLTWRGGAAPMIQISATRFRFKDFAIKNLGTATDFMELNSGAQSFHWERLYCLTTGHTSFSRSFIRSNGNRIGYSHMRECLIGSIAPVIFEIDGQSTPNAITNLIIDGRCIFTSDTAAVTVVKLIDEGIESLTIRDCTFNQYQGELCIVDTRTVSYVRPIDIFIFQGNEQDALPASDQATWRNFKLTNVSQILFDGNKLSGGGVKTFLADLVNSHVVSARGNYFGSISTALFNCDDACSVRGFYSHGTGSGRNVITNRRAGVVQLTYGAGIAIDGRNLDQSKHEMLYLDVTSGSSYTINVDNASPEFWCIGQVFTLTVRNTTAGVISAPTFGTTFNIQGVPTAPAAGMNRSFTFAWDGTKAIELSRTTADVTNS